MDMWSGITQLHIVLGFLALGSFWVPLLLKKGSRGHRAVGRVFLTSMAGLGLSGLLLSGATLLDPIGHKPNQDPEVARTGAIFLGYLAVVTLVIVHNARAALVQIPTPERWREPWRLALQWVSVGSAIGLVGLALWRGVPLLAAMAPVGLAVAGIWRTLLRDPATPRQAGLRAHIGSTLSGGIAVHTAFLAGGGARFLPEVVSDLGLIAWLLPTAVGVPAMILYQRSLQVKPR
jgi:hypothetical protein